MRGINKGTPLKAVILPLLARFNVKMAADRRRHAASTVDELLRNVNIDDLK